MNGCLCVNLDNEEYLNFGDFDKNIEEEMAASKTLKYFLATEWAKNRIVFIFEKTGESSFFPEEQDAYKYVLNSFDERSVLNRVPEYAYVVNADDGEYYFAAALPESKNAKCINPLPFLLSEANTTAFNELRLNAAEEANVGSWLSRDIRVTNNKNLLNGFKIFESPYVAEMELPLNDLNIVVTGTLRKYSRADTERIIMKLGGKLQNSVTKKTDFLVVAEKPGKTKLDAASKYSTRIITEKEFYEIIGE